MTRTLRSISLRAGPQHGKDLAAAVDEAAQPPTQGADEPQATTDSPQAGGSVSGADSSSDDEPDSDRNWKGSLLMMVLVGAAVGVPIYILSSNASNYAWVVWGATVLLLGYVLRVKRVAADPNGPKKAPPGVPIPVWWTPKGMFYHLVLRAFWKRPDRVPEIGKRQRLSWTLEQGKAEMRFWAANIEQITMVILNPIGGSGKSLTSVTMGEVYCDVVKRPALVMPGTEATDNSATGSYTGIDPNKAMPISRFYRLCGMLPDDRLKQLIPTTHAGLMVITEDPIGVIAVNGTGVTAKQSVPATATAKRIAQAVIIDSGNDTVKLGSIVLEAIRDADVVGAVATPSKPLSLMKWSVNVAKYMTDLTSADNIDVRPDQLRAGRQIPTRDKAAATLAIFTGVENGEGPDDYVKWTRLQLDNDNSTSIGFVGTVLTIPELRRYKRLLSKRKVKKGGTRPDIVIKPSRLTKTEYLAYVQTWLAAYRTAAALQGLRIKYDPLSGSNVSLSLQMSDEELVARFGVPTTRGAESSTDQPNRSTALQIEGK